MKVVLFCGGLGTRLREYSGTLPKPMVNLGGRPILWHLLKYYAHFGHCDFILCLGYGGDQIRQYFVDYAAQNPDDLRLSAGADEIRVHNRDGADWTIVFAQTGTDASIGQRLSAIRPYLQGEAAFLANYSDGLSNLPLPEYLDHFQRGGKIASFVCVRPRQSFHTVSLGEDGLVRDIRHASASEFWINGGFFAFKQEVFDYLKEGEDLVAEPFQRLIEARQLSAYRYHGFWACMDTFKDKQAFDDLDARGETPWQVWRSR